MRLAASMAMLVVVLAGCSDGAKDPAGAEDPLASPTTVAPGAASANVSLDALPRWPVGQSWTWSVASSTTEAALQAKTSVLAFDGSTYSVGAPDPDAVLGLYPFHLVPLGPIDAATLAWQAHGTPVQFLRFPIVVDDQFTSDFWSAPGADVFVTAAQVATPAGTEPGYRSTAYYGGTESVFMEADYAPSLGQFVRIATFFGGTVPFAEATLVGTGLNATGEPFLVTELARWTARADDPTTLTPRPFTVHPDTDTILLACFVTGQGSYQALVAAPGWSTSCGMQGSDATKYVWATTSGGDGDGTVVASAGGAGTITVEAFAIDIGGA